MPDPRPNILLIMTDQQRLDTISSMGNRLGVATPAMDMLVREGVTFSNAFCTAPICGPSRSTIMTGLYPTQAGVPANLGPNQPLSPMKLTIANRMQELGYETAYHGKWHLGGDLKDFGWEHGVETGYDDLALTQACTFYRRDWLVNKRPFFQVVSFLNPHDLYFFDPLEVPDEIGQPWPGQDDPLTNKPSPQRLSRSRDWPQSKWAAYRHFYGKCVQRVDAQIGELLHQLRCSGFAHNTWVIFCADHGDQTGENSLAFKGPWMYDGVLRVPLVVMPPRRRFVGKGKGDVTDERFEGRTCLELASLTDIVPTVLDLAGGKSADDLPGKSLIPHCTGGYEKAAGHDAVFAEWHQYGRIITPIRTIRTRQWKYNHYLQYGEELYDLVNDPKELTNLAGASAHASVQRDLKNRLDGHLKKINDPFYSLQPTELDGNPKSRMSLVET